jgi:hypothetical protein
MKQAKFKIFLIIFLQIIIVSVKADTPKRSLVFVCDAMRSMKKKTDCKSSFIDLVASHSKIKLLFGVSAFTLTMMICRKINKWILNFACFIVEDWEATELTKVCERDYILFAFFLKFGSHVFGRKYYASEKN